LAGASAAQNPNASRVGPGNCVAGGLQFMDIAPQRERRGQIAEVV